MTDLVAPLVLTLVLPLGFYLLASLAASRIDGARPTAVVCFEPATAATISTHRAVAAVLMAGSAIAFLFVVPGLLGTLAMSRRPATRSMAHAWSLAANCAALVLLCLVLRHTCGLDRNALIIAWLTWTALLFGLAWQPGRSWDVLGTWQRRYGLGLLIGLLVALAAFGVFFPEQFLQCFNEDGIETRELARSLRSHFLPYWEMDTWEPIPGGRMGTVVVNPSLMNSYWTCALQVLLGDNEPPTRLAYWVWWMAAFAAAYRMVRQPRVESGERRVQSPESRVQGFRLSALSSQLSALSSGLSALALALAMLLITVLLTFYVGYNPYMADLANPGVVDALFTLLLLLSLDCLRQKDRWGWVISVGLASLVLYTGVLLLVATLIAAWLCKPIDRRETLRWGFRGAALLLAVVAFYLVYGWLDGSLPYWVDTIDIEYVNDYLAAVPRWKSGPLFAGYFVLGCGGITVLGLLGALRRDAWQRTVATATLLYLLVALCSGFKNLHYLCPLLPVPVVLFLMPNWSLGSSQDKRQADPWRRSLLAACSIGVCILLCWPRARQTFTLNRQLGLRTTIATDSYLTAVQWARLRYAMRRQGTMSWDCDQHTWAGYAERDAELKHPRPLVLTDGNPPPGYRLIAPHSPREKPAIGLYARDATSYDRFCPWLSGQQPLRPLDRYSAVFGPLADGPYSPHNNALDEVQRLQWPW